MSASVLGSRGHTRSALSLVEVALSTIIVGVMLVAALESVALTRTWEYKVAERGRALLLAQDLMAEILQQEYADPVYGLGSFGKNATEGATGNRSLFDDVDDYDGWVASPPEERDDTPIDWAQGYERSVAVSWVDPVSVITDEGSESGVKRIVVTVTHEDREIFSLCAYRTAAWVDPVELQGGGS